MKYIYKIFFKLTVALTAVGAVACGVALKKQLSHGRAQRGCRAFPCPVTPGQDNSFPAKNHYDFQTCTKTRYWASKQCFFQNQSLKIDTFLQKRISVEKSFLIKMSIEKNRCSQRLDVKNVDFVMAHVCFR